MYYDKPVEKKYLQISYCDFEHVIGSKRFEEVRKVIYDHHCQMATKEGMFIVERFFGNDVNDDDELEFSPVVSAVIDYLKHYGYPINPQLLDYEDCVSIVEGYDGVLFNWTW